jgi:hypothetical protein
MEGHSLTGGVTITRVGKGPGGKRSKRPQVDKEKPSNYDMLYALGFPEKLIG